MKAVAAERRRFGYRRIHIMLDRQGIVMNLKKLRRLYSEERLQVRKRGGRKRALGTRHPMVVPQAANERWSLDFVSDAFTDGRRFRVLAVGDDFTRECLALIADTSLSGTRVVRELDAVITRRGSPGTIVSDRRRSENDPGDRFPEEGHRVHLNGDSVLVSAHGHPMALHCTRKAYAKWIYRKLQRALPRRVPERSAVLDAERCPHPNRRLEGGLQPSQTPFRPWEYPAGGVCHKMRLEKLAA